MSSKFESSFRNAVPDTMAMYREDENHSEIVFINACDADHDGQNMRFYKCRLIR